MRSENAAAKKCSKMSKFALTAIRPSKCPNYHWTTNVNWTACNFPSLEMPSFNSTSRWKRKKKNARRRNIKMIWTNEKRISRVLRSPRNFYWISRALIIRRMYLGSHYVPGAHVDTCPSIRGIYAHTLTRHGECAHPSHEHQHSLAHSQAPACFGSGACVRRCFCMCATSVDNQPYAIRLGMKLYEVVAWIVHTKLVKKRAPFVRQVEITVAILCALLAVYSHHTERSVFFFFFLLSHRCWFFTTFHFTYRSFVVSEIQLARSNTHFLCFKYRFVQW